MRRLCLLALALPCLGAGPRERDAHELPVDHEAELPSAASGPLPVLGPRQALVTIDVLQPPSARDSQGNMALLLRLLRELPDLRLVYHPVPTTPLDERGAEALWEALGQGRFLALCERLHARPELLGPEREAELLQEAGRLGLDAARLRGALSTRAHRARVQELWRRDREFTFHTPELRVNGRRLRDAVPELQLRDEIERQRERALSLSREGVPMAELYERLVQAERARALPWSYWPGRQGGARPPAGRVHVDLQGAPRRGPDVAPVSLVLFVSLDALSSGNYAELVRAVLSQHGGQVRLAVKLLPTPGSNAGLQAAWHLSALAERGGADFWRGYDALVRASRQRVYLSARDVREVLGGARIDLTGVPPFPTPGPAQARLEADQAQARRLGIEGPPALLVNGLLLRGSLSADSLEELVRRELELGLIGRLREGAEN